jgi:hypothetical protein
MKIQNKRPRNRNQIFKKTHLENSDLKNTLKHLQKEIKNLKKQNHDLQKENRLQKLEL